MDRELCPHGSPVWTAACTLFRLVFHGVRLDLPARARADHPGRRHDASRLGIRGDRYGLVRSRRLRTPLPTRGGAATRNCTSRPAAGSPWPGTARPRWPISRSRSGSLRGPGWPWARAGQGRPRSRSRPATPPTATWPGMSPAPPAACSSPGADRIRELVRSAASAARPRPRMRRNFARSCGPNSPSTISTTRNTSPGRASTPMVSSLPCERAPAGRRQRGRGGHRHPHHARQRRAGLEAAAQVEERPTNPAPMPIAVAVAAAAEHRRAGRLAGHDQEGGRRRPPRRSRRPAPTATRGWPGGIDDRPRHPEQREGHDAATRGSGRAVAPAPYSGR